MGIAAATGVAAAGTPPPGDQANAVLSAGPISAIGPQEPFAFRGPMNVWLWADINTTLTTTAGSLAATVGSGTGLAAGVSVESANVPPGTTIGTVVGTAVTLLVPPITLAGKTSLSAPSITGLPAAINTATLVGATVTGPGLPAAGATVTSASGRDVVISATPTAVTTQIDTQNFVFYRNGNAIATTGADANALFTGAGISFSATVELDRSFNGGGKFLTCGIGATGVLAQWTGVVTPISFTFGEPEKNNLYRFNVTAYVSGRINIRVSQTGGAAESLAIGPLSSG